MVLGFSFFLHHQTLMCLCYSSRKHVAVFAFVDVLSSFTYHEPWDWGLSFFLYHQTAIPLCGLWLHFFLSLFLSSLAIAEIAIPPIRYEIGHVVGWWVLGFAFKLMKHGTHSNFYCAVCSYRFHSQEIPCSTEWKTDKCPTNVTTMTKWFGKRFQIQPENSSPTSMVIVQGLKSSFKSNSCENNKNWGFAFRILNMKLTQISTSQYVTTYPSVKNLVLNRIKALEWWWIQAFARPCSIWGHSLGSVNNFRNQIAAT